MKRQRISIKKTIKKGIEERNANLTFIEKRERMINSREIHKSSDLPNIRNLTGSDRLALRAGSLDNIIGKNAYPLDHYKEILTNESKLITNLRILFLISNYERKEMLKELLIEIKGIDEKNVTVDYIIFDDVSSYKLDDPNFKINSKHRGKFHYWETFNEMFQYCKNNCYDIYVFTPNDFLNNNFNKIIEYGRKLHEHKYIFNTLLDARTTCWNNMQPVGLTDEVRLQFFTDCGFFTNHKTLEALEFKMNPIHTRNKNLGSQVGRQMTERINKLRIPIFTPTKSFVYHGTHPSVMHIK